jgi:ankyrin repeat protein
MDYIFKTENGKSNDSLLHDIIMLNFHTKNDDIIDKIKFFLMFSPNVNIKSKFTDSTPTHYLLMLLKNKHNQSVNMVPYFKLLLDFIRLGANMKIENKNRIKPSDIFDEIMNIVDSDGNTLLFKFVMNKEYDIAMLAIELGANINLKNKYFHTIFDYAIKNFNEDFDNIENTYFIDFLHRRDVNKNTFNMFSCTPVNLITHF